MKAASILASIAAGGAIGAIARYWIAVHAPPWTEGAIPLGTVVANVVGSFAFGLVFGLLEGRMAMPHELRVFLLVGVLGAFTTFSTLALDVVLLAEREHWLAALQYVVVSMVLGIGMLFVGLTGVRTVRRRRRRAVDTTGMPGPDGPTPKSD